MKSYLGYITIEDGKYYNFYPVYCIENEKIVKIENPREDLNLLYGNYSLFCVDRDYPLGKLFNHGEFCIIDLFNDDILIHKETEQGTSYKIYIDQLDKKGQIHELNNYGLYPIVSPSDIDTDLLVNKSIAVDGNFSVGRFTNQSVLYYDRYYYGPFRTHIRAIDNRLMVNNENVERHWINRYSITTDENDGLVTLECDTRDDDHVSFLMIKYSLKECYDLLSTDKLLLEDYKDFLKINKNANDYYKKIGNHEISTKRHLRLKEILNRENSIEVYDNELFELLYNFVLNQSNNKDIQNFILQCIDSRDEFLYKIQSFAIAKKEVKNLEEQKKSLIDEIKKLESSIKKLDVESTSANSKEIENLKSLLDDRENTIKSYQDKEELNSSIELLEKRRDDANKKYGAAEQSIKDKTKELLTKFESDMESKLKTTDFKIEEFYNRFIDDIVSDRIIEIDRQNDIDKYNKIKNEIKVSNTSGIEESQLIDYIVKSVKIYRPGYDKNTILNIMICLCQGLLTVFSGEPGIGKTSICKIIAHVLGLDNPLVDGKNKRFVTVPVEKGWTSKRDLIGYYNPLSRKIEKSNIELYDAFKTISVEDKDSFLPMIILLDEANLSPMEFYWTDFLGMCDDFKYGNNSINLGDDENLVVPNTLRFLATINNDQTTESLSPRLIDRSFVITLEDKSDSLDNDIFSDGYARPIEMNKLLNCFDSKKVNMNEEQNMIYNDIADKFKNVKQSISPRVKKAVEKYCSIANVLFESDENNNVDKSIIALDYAISQRVITKIRGTGEVYSDFLTDLSSYCLTKNLHLSNKHIKRIIDNGNMGYYQFFD